MNFRNINLLLMLFFIQVFYKAIAGEVTLNAGVEAELIKQKTNVKSDETKFDSTNRLISPYVSLYYGARDVNFSFRGAHNRVSRGLDSENVTNSYTNFTYLTQVALVRNVLLLDVGGTQGYTSNRANSYLSDDFLLNASNLNKTNSNNASLRLNLARGDFFGLTIDTKYSTQKSERNTTNVSAFDNPFDNEVFSSGVALISGEKLSGARISLNGSVNYTKRAGQDDFINSQANLLTNIQLIKNVGLVLSSYYQNTEIKSELESGPDENSRYLREFYSIGAGLNWQSRPSRSISILWNRSYTDSLDVEQQAEQQDKEEDNYISATIDWEFSPRTYLNAGYSRRLYGDAGNLSFRHSLRNWRSSITYKEQVTTNSQLVNIESLGLFVCDNGAQDISECSLSESLEPILEDGQFLQPIANQSIEFNDRVVLSKGVTLQTAITRRRTTISIVGAMLRNEEVEINRQIDTNSIATNIAFNFSEKTKLVASYRLSDAESLLNGELSDSKVKETSIKLTRALTRQLNISLGLRYLDSEGNLNQGANLFGIQGPFTDRRISLAISYNFGNRQ